jgi:hypothetical protein
MCPLTHNKLNAHRGIPKYLLVDEQSSPLGFRASPLNQCPRMILPDPSGDIVLPWLVREAEVEAGLPCGGVMG